MVIYKISNKINGKSYIGQTMRTPNVRIIEHKYKLSLIGAEIKKFGADNFDLTILEHCNTKKDLNLREEYWIKHYNTISPNGYNLAMVNSRFGITNSFYGKHHKKEAIKNNLLHQKTRKKIICLDTGVIYESMRECARKTGLDRTNIKRVCENKLSHTSYPKFKYYKKNERTDNLC